MGLYKKGKVWWFIKQYKGRRIEESLGTENKKLAERRYAEKLPKILDGRYFSVEQRDITFRELQERYMEKNAKLKRQIKGAMMYPLITLSIAVIVVIVILVFVIPVFESMFADFGDQAEDEEHLDEGPGADAAALDGLRSRAPEMLRDGGDVELVDRDFLFARLLAPVFGGDAELLGALGRLGDGNEELLVVTMPGFGHHPSFREGIRIRTIDGFLRPGRRFRFVELLPPRLFRALKALESRLRPDRTRLSVDV